jgi:hypothetical protein
MSTDQERIHDGWLLHMLTIREPWLLKKISTSNASTWLAGKGIDATRSSRFAARGQVDRNFQKTIIKKREANKRVPKFACTKDDFKRNFRIILLTPYLFRKFGVLTTHCFESAILFKLMRCICLWRHYAHARAVWCSWCTLEWLGYPYALVIPRAIKSRERIYVTSCYLTTKIPSALLVAVGWLQHTRYPRFRRDTFGYGVTTSPIQRGKAEVRSFHVNAH